MRNITIVIILFKTTDNAVYFHAKSRRVDLLILKSNGIYIAYTSMFPDLGSDPSDIFDHLATK